MKYALVDDEFTVRLIWPWSSLWWRQSIRWRNIDVQIVADGEFRLCKSQIFIGSTLAGTGDTNFTHPIARTELVGKDEGKIKIRTATPCIGIDIAHKCRQFFQCGILPCVDLQFVWRHIAMGEFVGRVMASGGAEYTQQQWTCLFGPYSVGLVGWESNETKHTTKLAFVLSDDKRYREWIYLFAVNRFGGRLFLLDNHWLQSGHSFDVFFCVFPVNDVRNEFFFFSFFSILVEVCSWCRLFLVIINGCRWLTMFMYTYTKNPYENAHLDEWQPVVFWHFRVFVLPDVGTICSCQSCISKSGFAGAGGDWMTPNILSPEFIFLLASLTHRTTQLNIFLYNSRRKKYEMCFSVAAAASRSHGE